MQNFQTTNPHAQNLRGANATFLYQYAQFATHELTLTFAANIDLPSTAQIDAMLKHLRAKLNWALWGKLTKTNPNAKVLYLPILEGQNGNVRPHVHILLGNIKDVQKARDCITAYISGTALLGFMYTFTDLYSEDGISWYLTKETSCINQEAIRWEAAFVHAAIIPKQATILKA
jgi:hypothetical protein